MLTVFFAAMAKLSFEKGPTYLGIICAVLVIGSFICMVVQGGKINRPVNHGQTP